MTAVACSFQAQTAHSCCPGCSHPPVLEQTRAGEAGCAGCSREGARHADTGAALHELARLAAGAVLSSGQAQAGIAAGNCCDTTNALMPGQKFKYWEERRVKLRVELGPHDMAAGTCVLATAADKPGDLATKVKHKARAAAVCCITANMAQRTALRPGACRGDLSC